MTEIIKIELDIKGQSKMSLKALKTAVSIAINMRDSKRHKISTQDICTEAGLVGMKGREVVRKLLPTWRKVLFSREVIDLNNKNSDSPWASWGVFGEIVVSDKYIEFEMSHPMYQQEVYDYFCARVNKAINS